MARKVRISSLLRNARKNAGLSQRALAKRAGTTQAVVARLELGLVTPEFRTLERLAKASGHELRVRLRRKPVLDRQLLDDVPRILRLTPEERLREVANINRFISQAVRVGRTRKQHA